MILCNSEIIDCLARGAFKIDGLPSLDPSKTPFNTSAVDLRLSNELVVPFDGKGAKSDLIRLKKSICFG